MTTERLLPRGQNPRINASVKPSLAHRRVFGQLSEAGAPPPAETEAPAATTRRLFIRVARLTASLAVILVVIPLLPGASDDFLGNAAAIGAGALLSNGYACALLHLSARKWEQTHDRLILHEVRPHWSIRPTVVYVTAK